MCGRFTLHHTAAEVAARFNTVGLPVLELRYNIAPTQAISVVLEDRGRQMTEFRWGLVPSWAKDEKIGSRMINARAETLPEKPAYRAAFQRRRCLIPADGFYEWMAKDDTKAGREPIYFSLKDNGLFGFAGLWDEWISPDGSPLRSCTLITTTPNSLVQPVHDRMPAILREENEADWLDPSLREPEVLTAMLAPYPADRMEAHAVSRSVNSPAADSPECIRAI